MELALLLGALVAAAPTGGGLAQLSVRAEPRLTGELVERTPSAFELDLVPRLFGRHLGRRHYLSLGYGPRLIVPTEGASFRHLHRAEATLQGALTRRVRLRLRQHVEVGQKDFRHPVGQLEASPETVDAAFGSPDAAEPAEAPTAAQGEAPPLLEQAGPEGVEIHDDAPVPDDNDDDDAEAVPDDLPAVWALPWLLSSTELSVELDATPAQRYALTLRFLRSGAFYKEERPAYPERLAPSLTLDGTFRPSAKDRLRARLHGELDLFAPGHEVVLGRTDLSWLRALSPTTDLQLGAGLGLWHSTDPQAPYELQLAPVGQLGLVKRVALRRGRLALEVVGSLAPYVSPVHGRTDPRLAASARLTFDSILGMYVGLSGTVSSRLVEWSPQGLQSLSSATVGYRFPRIAALEAGGRALVRVIPPAPGHDAGEGIERFTFFAALLLDTGPLF